MRVFLTHDPEDLEAYYARALPDLVEIADVEHNPIDRDLSTAELIDAAAGCDVIIAHRSTPGEAALFERSSGLLAFLRCAVDTSTIDVDAASFNGVLVARADKSFVASTAELALGLLLSTMRNIATSTTDYAAGRLPVQRPGRQLRGRTAGIIGYGAIGSYLADLLISIGMEVLVHDPFVADPGAEGITFVDFEELLRTANVIFPLAPGSAATEHLVGAPELALITPGSTLINVSRGELLDEAAVAAALISGQLGGLGLDVGQAPDQRPSPKLAAMPGVVATPHLGGLTPENADAQAASSVEQVAAMIAGEIPPRALNAEHAARLRDFWKRPHR
ncbi:MAG: NAD(P)-dependent oxidoreductase [Acidimicrobiia bacterium]|nr:NAD(P)-dependent oxidoreductase [Acidimicrobiia bacterium]